MDVFFQYLSIYFLAICCSCVAGIALAWKGQHIATRGKNLQIFCVAQGALTGSLIAVLFSHYHDFQDDGVMALSGVFFSLLCGIFVGVIVETINRDKVEKSNILVGIFVLIMAFNAYITAIIPELETHMSQIFFGDLVTISHQMALSAATFFSFLIVREWKSRFLEVNMSFEIAILRRKQDRGFILDSTVIALSVQAFGFLYTLGMIILPTTAARICFVPGMHRHYIVIAIGSFIGGLVGFSISLIDGRLPTVPSILFMSTLATLGISFSWRQSQR